MTYLEAVAHIGGNAAFWALFVYASLDPARWPILAALTVVTVYMAVWVFRHIDFTAKEET